MQIDLIETNILEWKSKAMINLYQASQASSKWLCFLHKTTIELVEGAKDFLPATQIETSLLRGPSSSMSPIVTSSLRQNWVGPLHGVRSTYEIFQLKCWRKKLYFSLGVPKLGMDFTMRLQRSPTVSFTQQFLPTFTLYFCLLSPQFSCSNRQYELNSYYMLKRSRVCPEICLFGILIILGWLI